MKLKRFKSLLLLTILGLLSSCSNLSPHYTSSKSSLLSGQEYFQLANSAQDPTKSQYLLKAASRFIDNHQPNQAQLALNQITLSTLTNDLVAKKQLLQANIYLLQNQYARSLPILQNLSGNESALSKEDQITLFQSLALAYQKLGNIAGSIEESTQGFNLLSYQDQKVQWLQTLLQNLQQMDTSTLTQLLNQNPSPNVKGWVSLALIMSNPNQNAANLATSINEWRSLYPKHIANLLLPNQVKQPNHIITEPKNIALLLPLHGKLAGAGNAIKNGFFAAYYHSKKYKSNSPNIIVLDTSRGDITELYQQAIAEGADFVVGPLSKSDLNTLIQKTTISVPTLALNTLSNGDTIKNLFQFGLSPVDEAEQVATKAWNNHYSHALIIGPNNAWGKNVAEAFSQTWKKVGGSVVGQFYYQPLTESIAPEIKHLLKIDLSDTQLHQLRQVLGEKIRFIPRRRKDVDVIFLIAEPNMARQIKPILKYYYAGDIPVYSISQIYDGIPNASRDRDLNGIIFCDMPWVLSARQMESKDLDSIQKNVETLWARSYEHYPKLYALGVDAYNVIPNLPQLAMLPQFGIKAATGTLFLKNQHLYRQLQWSQIKYGKPQLIQ